MFSMKLFYDDISPIYCFNLGIPSNTPHTPFVAFNNLLQIKHATKFYAVSTAA